MNQNTNTIPQPHPWVTASTPDNLRDPQLLQDLSEIGMTCLLGWHTLSAIPYSQTPRGEWAMRSDDWSKQMERLLTSYTDNKKWLKKFPRRDRSELLQANYYIGRAYIYLTGFPSRADFDVKTCILQCLLSANNIIRHMVKGEIWGPFGKIPMPGEPDFLDYDPETKLWIPNRVMEDNDEYQD